jgi:hypothetical protein
VGNPFGAAKNSALRTGTTATIRDASKILFNIMITGPSQADEMNRPCGKQGCILALSVAATHLEERVRA